MNVFNPYVTYGPAYSLRNVSAPYESVLVHNVKPAFTIIIIIEITDYDYETCKSH